MKGSEITSLASGDSPDAARRRRTVISPRVIGRLSLYRRLLEQMQADGIRQVYSRELAVLANASAAQVRRDLMIIGYSGTPTRGYDVNELSRSVGQLLDNHEHQAVAMVGVGNLGRAILAYFQGRRTNLTITAAFDADPEKVGRVVGGCRIWGSETMPRIIPEQDIRIAILTLPASDAQVVTDRLVQSGVRAILNFTNVRLRVPHEVFVEDIDFIVSLEKVAFFARQNAVKAVPS